MSDYWLVAILRRMENVQLARWPYSDLGKTLLRTVQSFLQIHANQAELTVVLSWNQAFDLKSAVFR
jgi:hypothetical protein